MSRYGAISATVQSLASLAHNYLWTVYAKTGMYLPGRHRQLFWRKKNIMFLFRKKHRQKRLSGDTRGNTILVKLKLWELVII